jgi:hypothetical protein
MARAIFEALYNLTASIDNARDRQGSLQQIPVLAPKDWVFRDLADRSARFSGWR